MSWQQNGKKEIEKVQGNKGRLKDKENEEGRGEAGVGPRPKKN